MVDKRSIITSLNPSDQKILNIHIYFANRYKISFPGLALLSKMSGLCERQVRRIHRKLEGLNLLFTQARNYESPLYRVTSLFNDRKTRFAFCHILSALAWLPVWWLESAPINNSHQNVRLLKEYINYKSLVSGGSGSGERYTPENHLNLYKGNDQKPDTGPQKVIKAQKSENLVMNFDIPTHLQNIHGLPLTLAGQVRLLCFPQQAVSHAVRKLQTQKGINNPFQWVFKVCEAYCKENGLAIDWRKMYDANEHHGIKPSDPFLMQKPVVEVQSTPRDRYSNVYHEAKPPLIMTDEERRIKSDNPFFRQFAGPMDMREKILRLASGVASAKTNANPVEDSKPGFATHKGTEFEQPLFSAKIQPNSNDFER